MRDRQPWSGQRNVSIRSDNSPVLSLLRAFSIALHGHDHDNFRQPNLFFRAILTAKVVTATGIKICLCSAPTRRIDEGAILGVLALLIVEQKSICA